MSSPAIQAIRASKSLFVPCKLEIITIGRTSVSLYPQIDEKMTNPKKAMAYQHNKTALASADLDQRARILTLADRLNLMLTAESSLADWECKLSCNWANFKYLMILSWHDAKETAIALTTTVVVLLASSLSPSNSSWTLLISQPPPLTRLRTSSCEGNITSNFPRVCMSLLTREIRTTG
jgi:hypothetical protein